MDAKRSARILVVDDDEDVRAFLVRALEALGHSCGDAADGPTALEELSASAYDLVLIDFAMPRMSGAELADEIRARTPFQKLLLISGYAGTAALQRAAGDVSILAKPITVSALAEAVKTALEAADACGD